MSEALQTWLAFGGWGVTAIFSLLYAAGGRTGIPKAVRRWIGGLLLAGATVALSLTQGTYTSWFLLSLVTLPAALSLGYGGPHGSWKLFRRRGIYGALLSGNALVFAIPQGGAILEVAYFQMFIGITASILFGMRNQFNNAPKEEAVIGGLCVCLIPFCV